MTKGQAHVQTGKAVKSRVKVDPHFRTLRALAQDVRLGLWIHVCALLKHLSSLLLRIIDAAILHAHNTDRLRFLSYNSTVHLSVWAVLIY